MVIELRSGLPIPLSCHTRICSRPSGGFASRSSFTSTPWSQSMGRDWPYSLGGLNCPGGGGGGGGCEVRAIHGVEKMVNYDPLIAHSAQRMKFLAQIMPHIVQMDHFACN